MPTATHDPVRTPRNEHDATPFVIESCHSIWLFDEANHRFRRMVKGLGSEATIATDWRAYDHLVVEEHSDAFLVFLDDSGTRLLRSRRHLGPTCGRCTSDTTRELSLQAIATFANSRPTTQPTVSAN
jgi:alpha-amylase/alpha-mannosidase (GH57 family)